MVILQNQEGLKKLKPSKEIQTRRVTFSGQNADGLMQIRCFKKGREEYT